MSDTITNITQGISGLNPSTIMPDFSSAFIWIIVCICLVVVLLLLLLNGQAMYVFAHARWCGLSLVEIIQRDHKSMFLECVHDPVTGNWIHYVKDVSKRVLVKMTFIPNPEAVRILFGVPLLTTLEGYSSGLSPQMAVFMQTCVKNGIPDPKAAAALDDKLRTAYNTKLDAWKKVVRAELKAGREADKLTPVESMVDVPNGLVVQIGEDAWVDWKICEGWINKIGPAQLFDLEVVNEAIAVKQSTEDKKEGDMMKFMMSLGILAILGAVAFQMVAKAKECDVTTHIDTGFAKCESYYAKVGMIPVIGEQREIIQPIPTPPPAT